MPPVLLQEVEATFHAIYVSGFRRMPRVGGIVRPSRLIPRFAVPLHPFSDTPFASPAVRAEDVAAAPVMRVMPQPAARAGR